MAGNFLAGDFLAHAVTVGDFMAVNLLAGDFLGGYRRIRPHVKLLLDLTVISHVYLMGNSLGF